MRQSGRAGGLLVQLRASTKVRVLSTGGRWHAPDHRLDGATKLLGGAKPSRACRTYSSSRGLFRDAPDGCSQRGFVSLATPVRQHLNTTTSNSRSFSTSSSQFQPRHETRITLQDLKATPTQPSTRVIISGSDNPYYNLSVEHYLLTNSDPESRVLFLYVNRQCVVYGRNQNPWVECNLPAIQNGLKRSLRSKIPNQENQPRPVPILRRRSGGGTVFHDSGNLNYCAIVPNDKSFSRNVHAEMVVRALQSVAQRRANFGGQEIKVNDRHDIVMRPSGSEGSQWLKVSGSAYKLIRGRALHHGTLLLNSPNLSRISGLLNGLGKELITTKGVGSVRSPVANLSSPAKLNAESSASYEAEATGTDHSSEEWLDLQEELSIALRSEIEEEIALEWYKMYGASENLPPKRLELPKLKIQRRKGPIKCEKPSDDPNDPVTHINKGVRELISPEWKYGQTPRFTFSSSREEDDASVRLLIEANRGVIEQVTLEKDGTTTSVDIGKDSGFQTKVWIIKDWKSWLMDVQKSHEIGLSVVAEDQSIIDRLEECFPKLGREFSRGGKELVR